MRMDISLLYFDDCPNWRVADERLSALATERADLVVTRHVVETFEEAERMRFHGSPSIQVDGVDLFADSDAAVGLSCRVYRTPDGPAGGPTMEQLRAALTASAGTAR
ncbi:MAG: thioredoxin family protein [Nocardioidaceae bacterium]|nr:thioredoxin family protein [Nocardioidaceae bacterium]